MTMITYVDDEAPGALPNGTRVVKCDEDPGGDHTPLGKEGKVLGSIFIPADIAVKMEGFYGHHPCFMYFVEWDYQPGVPIGVQDWKIAELS